MVPCDTVYMVVDNMPKFGDKDEELMQHLSKHLNFGDCGLDEMKTITWTIDIHGNMIDVDAPGLDNECRNKVVGQLKQFPKWKPGTQNGNPVCVKMALRMCIKTG
jgi:hypothetical protein